MFIIRVLDIREMQFIEPLIQQSPINDVIEALLYAAGTVLSAILTALSIFAYRKSGMKKLQYAVIAFSLFCGFLIYENLENLLGIDNPYTDIIIPSMGLTILVFFFLAVIKKSVIDKKLFYNQ